MQCGKVFPCVSYFKNHKITHSGEKHWMVSSVVKPFLIEVPFTTMQRLCKAVLCDLHYQTIFILLATI
jgi:hypothetical protein